MHRIIRRQIFKIAILLCACTPSTIIAKAHDIYPVDKNVLAVSFITGEIEFARQTDYRRHPTDSLRMDDQRHKWIYRGNRVIGTLVGPQEDRLFGFDQFRTSNLNEAILNIAQNYQLHSQEDANFLNPIRPIRVSRKSKPINMAYTAKWNFEFPVKHIVYLHFAFDLQEGKNYILDLSQLGMGSSAYKHSPSSQISEAIHISQIGFRPKDSVKVAYLSLWKGSLGGHDYGEIINYHIRNHRGESILSGAAKKAYDPSSIKDERLSRTAVYKISFGEIAKTGRYKVCVEGVGCSAYFEIADNAWKNALKVSFRGLYNQRSGIEIIRGPYNYSRPRNLHPDDGVTIRQSAATLLYSKNGLNLGGYKTNFEDLLSQKTENEIISAWGGYADAGDWDRRIQHLKVSRMLAELMEIAPEFMFSLELGLPDDTSPLPDVLREALWPLELFSRLQSPSGAVGGGIESAEHPRHGEASWQESQRLFAYAPDPWSSLLFAASAAKISRQLKLYDAAAAKELLLRAEKAAIWAERELKRTPQLNTVFQITDARNLAAVELFASTGLHAWHQVFLSTTEFTQPALDVESWGKYSQSDAAFTYARLKENVQSVADNIRSAFRYRASQLAQSASTTPYGWAMNNPDEWVGWGSLSVPQAVNLVRAAELEGSPKTIDSILGASQFGLGANPSNLSFTTGVGHSYPQNPLHHDHRVSQQAAPVGLTVNGPHDVKRLADHWLMPMLKSKIYPNYQQWPLCESYLDIYSFAPMTEFSTHNTIAPNLYVWAYLASQ